MQVFVPYSSPLKVAKCLDNKRLNKQIIECSQILDAMREDSDSCWRNHPVVKMYYNHQTWLSRYMDCLKSYRDGNVKSAKFNSFIADMVKPGFITNKLCDQHKRRLYTKDSIYYTQFSDLGKSYENWYVVDGVLLKYVNGKLLK